MGICGSKAGSGTGDMTSKIKDMAFSMMVKSGGGAENQNQFDTLKSTVTSQFPKANIQQEVDPNAKSGMFDVMMDGKKIHSNEINGSVENNKAGIMDSIKNMLLQKLKSAF
jgi:hypothetical protein